MTHETLLSRLLFGLLLPLATPIAAAADAPGTCAATLPDTMRAARIHAAGGPEALRVESVPLPVAAAGEVLVRVHYASVNPVDWKLQEAGRLPFPATPGGDFAGEVVAIGAGVDGIACGDLVAGIVNQRERSGSYAEYVAVPATEVVPKPDAFTLQEAAAYPTVAVAAWRYLVLGAEVQPGDRVLVHGGAGGVGSMAVQIAKARGAHVITTASARNHAHVLALGADQAIDYRSTRFEDVVDNVDIVVDTVGGETLTRSVPVLRPGGRLVSLAGSIDPAQCRAANIVCPADSPWNVREGLLGVAPLIAAGQLRVHIDGIYALDEVVAAQSHNRNGSTRGKVVIDMRPEAAAIQTRGDDVAAVRIPLQAYLDGHGTGQERHFRRAFADDAVLMGYRDVEYRNWPASQYIAASASGRVPADEAQRQRRIRSITVDGQVASAVIELAYPDMLASDHMSLLRHGDEWRIAVKAYDARQPATSP